jgi:oligopeptide/dipeptide ABC transporter ATP-binding protein
MNAPVLEIAGLSKHFPIDRHRAVHAVNDVSFAVARGEILALVGESGSGKSTIGRLALRLIEPSAGRVRLLGQDITELRDSAVRPLRSDMQMVFQDPWSALNPRLTVGTLIEEPIRLHMKLSAAERRERAAALAERVRLGRAMLDRYPGQLSGGQLQRVCIARALATDPKLVVLDEPTSSLDLSVRAGILDLLARLRDETGVAMLFITHDLGTLKLIADRVLVLYLGAVVEEGPASRIFTAPEHPYTQALLSAHLTTEIDRPAQRIRLSGEVPSPIDLPPGCLFAGRCPVAIDACRSARPPLEAAEGGLRVACIRLHDGGNRLRAGDTAGAPA